MCGRLLVQNRITGQATAMRCWGAVRHSHSIIGNTKLMPRQDVFAKSFMESRRIKWLVRMTDKAEKDVVKAPRRRSEPIRLKASGPTDYRDQSLEAFIEYLISQLFATKKMSNFHKREHSQVVEVPDNKARLRAVRKLLWLMGALPSPYFKSAKPKPIKSGANE